MSVRNHIPAKVELTAEDKLSREELKKKIRYMRDKDRQQVRGIFRFHEVPGGVARFCTKFYKEDPVEWWELQDNKIYELPLGVAKHLNKNCWHPEYEYVKSEGFNTAIRPGGHSVMGNEMMRVKSKVHRMSFQSLEFVDVEDLVPATGQVLQVEKVHGNISVS